MARALYPPTGLSAHLICQSSGGQSNHQLEMARDICNRIDYSSHTTRGAGQYEGRSWRYGRVVPDQILSPQLHPLLADAFLVLGRHFLGQ